MRLRSPLLAGGLGALVLAGCGSEDRALIPPDRAAQLTALVDDAGQASRAGECDRATRTVGDAENALNGLPRRTDADLKANLSDWLQHLDAEIEASCGVEEEPEPTATPTPTETPTPTPTATAAPTVTAEPTATAEPTVTADPGGGEGLPDEPEEPEGTGGVAPEEDG